MLKVTRIEIGSKIFDTRAAIKQVKFQSQKFGSVKGVKIHDVYTIKKNFSHKDYIQIAEALSNPVTQKAHILTGKIIPEIGKFDWVVEVGFLPGVTDNVATTAKEIISDLLKVKFDFGEDIFFSQAFFIIGKLSPSNINLLADTLYNPIIQKVQIKSFAKYQRDGGMDYTTAEVQIKQKNKTLEVNLSVSDEKLYKIGKLGIIGENKKSRGPLALSLLYMKAIQKYFAKIGRSPTDIELESIAQTWSEHCKHTIFADPIDDIKDGLFKHYIKRATEDIRKKKGNKDFCVSVFSDNSGGIIFNDKYIISHKVETHNSPSALDPFGGSVTGIVGVNRDAIGFGMGAKPVANFYGFCLADPRYYKPLFRSKDRSGKMLSPRRILDGVVEGVNSGGNQSGIPTPQGFLYFDDRFCGKPLVFVGTVGLLPKKIKNNRAFVKKAITGDFIVMAGGRVGKDGIHGATFSSESLSTKSPVSAVQIGDPITQKKLSDAIVKEARDRLLYNSITDNGAGGLSCSVAEMARESGGCTVYLEKVPVKYEGLMPWEIWISESQERMTLAVPKNKWQELKDLFESRGVEATIIGEFTDSGKCRVFYNGKLIMDIDLEFLHYGLPKKYLKTKSIRKKSSMTELSVKKDYTKDLLSMLARINITSFEFITNQYDYIVQGGLVLSPLSGRGRVNSDACAFRPVLDSPKAVMISQGINPSYSDIDTYGMAQACIDTAIRSAVAAGADLDHLALLDNFCWCSSNDPEKLGQLKEAVKGCYDLSVSYQTPFISGKDSMFNDFHGFDENGKQINISIPPTLLISAIGVINDFTKVVSMDFKKGGDFIYLLGKTNDELGASEYIIMINEKLKTRNLGKSVPVVHAERNKRLYHALTQAINESLIASSISISRGGLGTALAKCAIAGKLGMDVDLSKTYGDVTSQESLLFSESQGRIIVSVSNENKDKFEKKMEGNPFALIGKVVANGKFILKGLEGKTIINTNIKMLDEYYRKTFKGY